MIEFKFKEKHEQLEVSGSLVDIAAETCRMINLIYTRLSRHQPAIAAEFRILIVEGVTSARSPVWNDNGDVGNQADILIVQERET